MLDTSSDEGRPFSLRLPEDLAGALAKQAQAHARSRGAEVRFILREHLERPVDQDGES